MFRLRTIQSRVHVAWEGKCTRSKQPAGRRLTQNEGDYLFTLAIENASTQVPILIVYLFMEVT